MSAPLDTLPTWLQRRPEKRAECPPPDQQCPWASCRYHLALDVRKRHRLAKQARITYNLPPDPEDWPADAQTCALHLADDGPRTLEQLGAVMGDISRERVRQIEQSAADKLSQFGIILELAEDMGLDTDTRARNNQRPSAEAKGHRHPRPRNVDPDLDGTYSGPFRSQDMTAKMRRIQAESAAPVRTLSPDAIDLDALTASIRAKQPPPRVHTNARVTADIFTQRATDPRAEARYARSRESLRSFRRIEANDTQTAKAPPTTTPRPPCNPTPPPIEIPPTIQAGATPPAPTTIQSDDQPEVAVAAALPEPPPAPPSIPQQPMTRPDMRTRRSVYEDANETAKSNLAKIMAARGITRESLSAMARDTHTAHTPMSVDQAIVRAMNGTASPVSVWYRRIASLLGVPLSDLCDDPAWLAAVAPEDSPVAAAHAKPAPPPLSPIPAPPSPDASTKITPLFEALAKAQNQLSHVAGAAAHLEARAEDLEALAKVLRDEIADLQEQLAERTRERDDARQALAQIDAALTLTRKACP